MRKRLLVAALVSFAARAQAQQVVVEENIGPPLLPVERIAALPAPERKQWETYIALSQRLHAADTAFLNAEVRGAHLDHMVLAPYLAPDFRFGERDAAWFSTDSAKQLARSVLTWQTPSGGWSKRTSMWNARPAGTSYYSETPTWHYMPTFDNGATSGQLRFVGEMALRSGDAELKQSFKRGLALVFQAQQPNGCWPQSYPLDGGYHDAVTFNDDVAVLLMKLLDDVAAGHFPFVDASERTRAGTVSKTALACVLRAQVVQGGKRTVWGQQHDPITLAVVRARTYELPGLAGRESATILMYLMSLPSPNAQVRDAVNGAASWLEAHALQGLRYQANKLTQEAGAPPVWARLTDLETDKPIFANRDGIKLYDWDKLTDRRTGYGWFGTEPTAALERYREWSKVNAANAARRD